MDREPANAPAGSRLPTLPEIGLEPASTVMTGEPAGAFTSLDGEEFYRISAYHRLPPFLMSLASDTDLWMFVTSGGGLTAGRVDADGSLFPYENEDRLHDGHYHTGPVTLLRVKLGNNPTVLWQPFSERSIESFEAVERNLYKNRLGSRLVFEEINHDLQLAFRYRWSGSDDLGFVRTAWLVNLGSETARVSLLDGLRNVQPFGVPLALHQQSSSLVDAYKRTDCDGDTRIGIFSLTSQILDRPEAAEELRANTVWCHGLCGFDVCLSGESLDHFRRGEPVGGESVLTGRRGNYLVVSSLTLEPGARARWHFVADVGRSHVQLAALRHRLRSGEDLDAWIEESLVTAGGHLARIVASGDGLQLTAQSETSAHHAANVLFNAMRGGVFTKNYQIPTADLADFLRMRNDPVAARRRKELGALPPEVPLKSIHDLAEKTGDADFQRLCYEYLPLFFSRRHGDPSRPWNRFAIRVRNPDGSRALYYEGNWRDIFQNWEALSLSFPGFIPGFIAKFVNASTVDGFNPYRITRNGIDWEVIDPQNPWSHIGYWGDHQLIYLLRFLEAQARFSPGTLKGLLKREIFSYADVPYRLKPYEEIIDDPGATIVYDTDLAGRIEERVRAIGTDGKLLPGADGSIYHVNLLEKLLVPVLCKLSNLVPGGGIWMNTQRPEWNDANNALVGRGLSMVTLCHLRRFLEFLRTLVQRVEDETLPVSTEVVRWFRRVHAILDSDRTDAATRADTDRWELMDSMGKAFSEYREAVYRHGYSGKDEVPVRKIEAFCKNAMEHLDDTIRANRRDDGLYHSYNLLDLSTNGRRASLERLDEMLEGQVAVLSSGTVDAEEAVRLLSSLFVSRLFREDQMSFLLYPERELPPFREKNVIPDHAVRTVGLFRELLNDGDASLLERDAEGNYRFPASFRNARDLVAALDRLAETARWAERVAADRNRALEVFEEVFRHRSFTGRSGTMYAYEGIGCVYWHMVSKLLLAVQEVTHRAAAQGQPDAVLDDLARAYDLIRAGLGFEKTVSEYGAFPTDPYSHTPAYGGARQPGMTGQVKEQILARFGELGVHVDGGRVSFHPVLLKPREFLRSPGTFSYYDTAGCLRSILVPSGALAFTYCQVPVVYMLARNGAWLMVRKQSGDTGRYEGHRLDLGHSQALLGRTGSVSRIDVAVPESRLRSRAD